MKKFVLVSVALVITVTNALCQTGVSAITVTDIDGNTYNIIKIGDHRWLKENLKTTHFRDGSAIPEIKDSTEWMGIKQSHLPAWCYYQNNEKNNFTYGKLYNWYVVSDPRNVCPAGWHVPNDEDYEELVDYLGGYDISGSHMKTITLWSAPNTGADNSSGFTAVPAGLRFNSGGFYAIGDNTNFWTSSGGGVRATDRSLFHDNSSADHFHDYKENGFSVRCIED